MENLRNDKGFSRENADIRNAVLDLLNRLYQDIELQRISTSWADRIAEPVNILPDPRNQEMQANIEAYMHQYQRYSGREKDGTIQ